MLTRIAALSLAGFLLGIFYASLVPATPWIMSGALCSALFCLIAARFMRHFVIGALLMSAFALGLARFELARVHVPPELEARVSESVVIEGVVVAEPDVRERNIRLVVDVTSVDSVTTDGRVLVVAEPYTRVTYGDSIRTEGLLRKPEAFESGDGRTFDYPGFLAVRGITHELSFADLEVLGRGGNPLKHAALTIKGAYIRGLRAVLPEPYAGLAAGITAGDKRSVGSELSAIFQNVSLVHILVLSGYNITIVLGALMGPLSRLSRPARLCAVLIVVAFFAVISGGAASAIRAGAMAFCAVLAALYGRQYIALRVLSAVLFCMVAINPYLLVFDPGFQLSVLATLGLIVWAPYVERALSWAPIMVREIMGATIATQLLVLPLLLYTTGVLSFVAVPANVFALIAVPFAMLFSGLAAIVGVVAGSWGTLFALPAYVLLRYIVFVAEVFNTLPFATVLIPAFSPFVLLIVYTLMAGGFAYMYRRVNIELK